MMFKDRIDAGQRLAKALIHLKNLNPVILALPRGGVPVAFQVAKELQAPLDLLFVRKIGHPDDEEFGLGAVVDDGTGRNPQLSMNEYAKKIMARHPEYIEATKQRQLKEIQRQCQTYRGDRKPIPLTGRNVIVVDDGIATGGTVKAALKGLQQQGVERTVLAVPVAPPDTLAEFKNIGHEVVCLSSPPGFMAIGQFYERFDQTNDSEVIRCMEESQKFGKN